MEIAEEIDAQIQRALDQAHPSVQPSSKWALLVRIYLAALAALAT